MLFVEASNYTLYKPLKFSRYKAFWSHNSLAKPVARTFTEYFQI